MNFVAVTGSCGKTTTKELIVAVLSTTYSGRWNRGTKNVLGGLLKTVLSVRPRHRFCVQEVTVGGLGESLSLQEQLRIFQPGIGVITNIGQDHISALRSLDGIAAEKGRVISALQADGVAILNADDERVLSMRTRCAGSVITYGLGDHADIRGENVQGNWPDRLAMTVTYKGQSQLVETQLCGTHWAHCVLAAIGVGLALDVSLPRAAEALRDVPPVPGRMSPVSLANGVTVIRDDWKAPMWTIPVALDFLRTASAARKIVVIGTISDYLGAAAKKYVDTAKLALEVADAVYFVGKWASRALRARSHSNDMRVQAFRDVNALVSHFKGFLRSGDLVLLKGSNKIDHLGRVVGALQDGSAPSIESTIESAMKEPSGELADALCVVGLGNSESRFERTPHNVGQLALDILNDCLHGQWERRGNAMRSDVRWDSKPMILIKPICAMNATGSTLHQICEDVGLDTDQIVLLQDDVNLPIGDVRTRLRGSAGGHKGVASVIDQFDSEEIRRIKIGVGKPHDGSPLDQYVLAPFSAENQERIGTACRIAIERLHGLLA